MLVLICTLVPYCHLLPTHTTPAHSHPCPAATPTGAAAHTTSVWCEPVGALICTGGLFDADTTTIATSTTCTGLPTILCCQSVCVHPTTTTTTISTITTFTTTTSAELPTILCQSACVDHDHTTLQSLPSSPSRVLNTLQRLPLCQPLSYQPLCCQPLRYQPLCSLTMLTTITDSHTPITTPTTAASCCSCQRAPVAGSAVLPSDHVRVIHRTSAASAVLPSDHMRVVLALPSYPMREIFGAHIMAAQACLVKALPCSTPMALHQILHAQVVEYGC